MTQNLRRAAPFLVLAALVAVIVLVLTSSSGGYRVRAEFTDADGLTSSFNVRENGVVVGTVTSVKVTSDDRAMVTMKLNASAAPIGAGARATISPSNLLGEKYVALEPGDMSKPQPSGTLIPTSHSSVSPELDQVLDAFNANTRQATAVFLAEQGNALVGRGASLAQLLQELPGSLGAARQFVAGLASDNAALGQLIDRGHAVLASVTPRRAALGRLLQRADGTLQTFAQREQALGGTIAHAPGAIGQLHTTLVDLDAAARPLTAAAVGLRATAGPLASTLRALPTFTRAAVPTLTALSKAAPSLRRLGNQGTPLLRTLEPAASELTRFATALKPAAEFLGDDFSGMLDVLNGWARAIADRDGVGHVYRLQILVPNNVLKTLAAAPASSKPGTPAGSHPAGSAPAASAPATTPSTKATSQPTGTHGAGSSVSSTLGSLGSTLSSILGGGK